MRWNGARPALAAELVYGSLLRLNTLDWMIERFVRQGAGKLDDWVRQLLRLSFYQIKYLDRIPDRAAVHEAVELAKRRGHKGIAGFVNGVLRQCLRNPERTEIPAKWPAEKRMSLELSFPEWMLRGWVKAYGEKTAHEIAAALNESPRVNLRVNRLKADPETVIRRLREEHPRRGNRTLVSDTGGIEDQTCRQSRGNGRLSGRAVYDSR